MEAQLVDSNIEKTIIKRKSRFFGVDTKLKTIANAICNKHNINIEFGAGNPRTDGQNIYLPYLKPEVTNREMDVFIGYIHHEVGHCNYSDCSEAAREKLIGKLQGQYSKKFTYPVIKFLSNVVEDVRIETMSQKSSPGSTYYIETMGKDVSDYAATNYKRSNTVESACTDALMYICSNHFDFPYMKTHPILAEMKSNSHFDPLCNLIKPIVNKIKKTMEEDTCLEKCTQELMRRVAKYIATQNIDDSKIMSDEDTAEALEKLGEHINSNGSSTASMANGGNISSAGDKAKEKFMTKNTEDVTSTEKSMGLGNEATKNLCRVKVKKVTLDEAKKGSKQLRKAIVSSFMSHKNKLEKKYQDQGRLDMKRASRFLYQNKLNIFKDIHKFKRINTAVHLTVDISGSMNGSNMEEARKISMALEQALQGTNIRLAISVFDSSYYLLKQFNQSLSNEMVEIIAANGGTDLSKAVMTSSKYLYGTPEKRKIVIAITDGCVSGNIVSVDKLVRKEGIELYYVIVSEDENSVKCMVKNSPIDKQYCAGFGGQFSKIFIDSFRNLILHGKLKHTEPEVEKKNK